MPGAERRTGLPLVAGLAFSLARFASKLSRILQSIAARTAERNLQDRLVADSTHYDMVNAPDESYYAAQYWTVMEPTLNHLPARSCCLDLGCSQGRFAYMLAQKFPQGYVVGCDLSQRSIDAATAEAAERGIRNTEFYCRSIADQLPLCGENSLDVIVMTEVTFFYPDWQRHLPEMTRLLRPGGVLAMSFRSQYFNALCLTRGRNFELSDLLLRKRRGRIFPPSLTEFGWQTAGEVRSILEGAGLGIVALQGIGVCSGIPGDPHELIARPALCDEQQASRLMEIELDVGRTVPDAGRYILAVGQKTMTGIPAVVDK